MAYSEKTVNKLRAMLIGARYPLKNLSDEEKKEMEQLVTAGIISKYTFPKTKLTDFGVHTEEEKKNLKIFLASNM